MADPKRVASVYLKQAQRLPKAIRGRIMERVSVSFNGNRMPVESRSPNMWVFSGMLTVKGTAGEGWALQNKIEAWVDASGSMTITKFKVKGGSGSAATPYNLWAMFFYDWLVNDIAVEELAP